MKRSAYRLIMFPALGAPRIIYSGFWGMSYKQDE
jgi:hypothetical protein